MKRQFPSGVLGFEAPGVAGSIVYASEQLALEREAANYAARLAKKRERAAVEGFAHLNSAGGSDVVDSEAGVRLLADGAERVRAARWRSGGADVAREEKSWGGH